MTKKDCMNLVCLILLSFLYIVLLDDYYRIGLDSLMLMVGLLPVFIGINNSFHYVNLGLGMTRYRISNKYLIDLIYVILLGLIYLSLITILASIVYDSVNTSFINVVSETIFIYSITIFIASLSMFACNLCYAFKKKYVNIVFIVFIIILVVVFLLLNIYLYKQSMFLLGVVISSFLFIIFSFINKKILLSKKM